MTTRPGPRVTRDHADHVDAWIEATTSTLDTPARVARRMASGLDVVLQRARISLGGVLLMAILERVIERARDQHPLASRVRTSRREREPLIDIVFDLGDASRAEVIGTFRFLLVELLTVLGNMTAGALTPALHSELRAPANNRTGDGPSSHTRPKQGGL